MDTLWLLWSLVDMYRFLQEVMRNSQSFLTNPGSGSSSTPPNSSSPADQVRVFEFFPLSSYSVFPWLTWRLVHSFSSDSPGIPNESESRIERVHIHNLTLPDSLCNRFTRCTCSQNHSVLLARILFYFYPSSSLCLPLTRKSNPIICCCSCIFFLHMFSLLIAIFFSSLFAKFCSVAPSYAWNAQFIRSFWSTFFLVPPSPLNRVKIETRTSSIPLSHSLPALAGD